MPNAKSGQSINYYGYMYFYSGSRGSAHPTARELRMNRITQQYEGLVKLRTKSIFIAHQIARTPA
jgi:hypothetical protein